MLQTKGNDDIKYFVPPKNRLVEDTLAESIDDHLMAIYDLFKSVHPEWAGVTLIVGDVGDDVISGLKVLTEEQVKRLLGKDD